MPPGRALCERGRGAILPLRGRGQESIDTAGKTEKAGASPPPGAERATLFRCRPGLSRKRHWLTLPLWHPAGSLPGWSPDDYAFPESAGGLACFAARRPRLDLSLFPPSPQPPSPPGKGEIFWFSYARGFAPCLPGTEPGRHLQSLPPLLPGGGACPCLFCFACHIIAFPPIPLPPSRREGGDV